MQTLLSELKTIFRHELTIAGPFVPLPADQRDDDEGRSPSGGTVAGRGAPDGEAGDPDITLEAEPRAADGTARDGSEGDGTRRPGAGESVRDAPQDNEAAMPSQDLFGNPVESQHDASLTPYERIHALIPEDSPIRTMTSLNEVEAYVAETVLIPLDESRKNPVFGVGDPQADLMVIGEAPGADEDEQGEPFVGRAGQLLDKILEAIGFGRDDVYIANILKSRPPNNRNPLAGEVKAHVPILYKQIELIQPKILLCVGKTSGTTLLDKQTTLGAMRQKFHDFHGLPVVVTYHPAALLRNPNWKRPTWEDVQMLRRRYDELVEVPA